MRIKRDNVYKALSRTPAMWLVLNEWLFPSLFQQESEKTESTGNLYTYGRSVQTNYSASDSEIMKSSNFFNM